jgi:hypothetical protein
MKVHLLIIIAIILTGCSGNESREIDRRPDTADQIKESENRNATSDDTEPASEIEFNQEVIFGDTDEVLLGSFTKVAVDDSGRVYMADRDQITVHVFKTNGNYLTSLGNQGKGPGEFMAVTPYTTIALHSNRFYITDLADAHLQFSYRMHEFSLEYLSFSRTIDLYAVNKEEFEVLEGYYPNKIYPLNNGTFMVSYHRSPNEYRAEESTIYYVIQDSNGTIISGPVLKQKDLTNLVTEVTDTEFPYTAIHSFPFHGKSLLTVSRDNHLYAVNHSEEFEIDIYTTQGEHIRKIEHSFENIPLNRNKILDYYKKTNYGHGLGDGVALKMIREAENLPETWPAIESMISDDKNRLWVSTIVEDFDIYEWWVLEETGELITKFEWPRDEPIEVVRNGNIYTRKTDDETGLQQIVKYRFEINE